MLNKGLTSQMCNLYSLRTNQEAIRDIAKVWDDKLGNMPPLPGIYPDYLAPVVWNGEGINAWMLTLGHAVPYRS